MTRGCAFGNLSGGRVAESDLDAGAGDGLGRASGKDVLVAGLGGNGGVALDLRIERGDLVFEGFDLSLAIAHEAGADFTLKDIDRISRQVPCLAKVAPNSTKYHIEHVHRAGGIPALLGELNRAGLLHKNVHSVHADSLDEWLDEWDIRSGKASEKAKELFLAAPGGVRTTQAFSTANKYESHETDAENGCIRAVEHAYTKDGGLAVLYGNIAQNGAIIKSAGIDEELFHFKGRAFVVESQDEAVHEILSKNGKATLLSSSTRVRRVAPACRKCCTRPPT